MKNLFSLFIFIMFLQCSSEKEYREDNNDYEVVQQPNGQQAVYVQNGNESFWMEYAMFNMLMNNGGMRNVNNYYNTHHTTIISQQKKYNSYNNLRITKKDGTNRVIRKSRIIPKTESRRSISKNSNSNTSSRIFKSNSKANNTSRKLSNKSSKSNKRKF